jgi:hypothetical protein
LYVEDKSGLKGASCADRGSSSIKTQSIRKELGGKLFTATFVHPEHHCRLIAAALTLNFKVKA